MSNDSLPYIPPTCRPPWERTTEPENESWHFRDLHGNVISFDVSYEDDEGDDEPEINVYFGDSNVTDSISRWFPDLWQEIKERNVPNDPVKAK